MPQPYRTNSLRMIYFIQPADGGPVKIGYSDDVEARRRQLVTYYNCPLVLLGVMPGSREEEQAIHARFAHLRLGRTEQFRPAPDLMEFIGQPLPVDINPDTIAKMVASMGAILSVRGSEEWREWVHRFCDYCRLKSASDLIDQALAEHAKHLGFPDPPPKRLSPGTLYDHISTVSIERNGSHRYRRL
jgi:hypothetical protein